ncbi:myeloid leukemia factor-like [Hetaerina americana]|uniref:myeloid leukemia factor-like n=1 Tax=Hetaerina americana TaxID=62018 RepID=UPI003A7F4023
MNLFNFRPPVEDESFYMQMAAANQMSQMMQMHSIMMNPLANMGVNPLGLMGMAPQAMLGPAVGVPAIHPGSVPANPWFSPGGGSTFQCMSVLGGGANVHSYCSSTQMSMSTGPDGRPVVYQATSSTRSGPGGVHEVQKSVCDNVTGTKKMQIGRHIGNRGHVVEREQNYISGEREEREDFINIDEDEAEKFTEEFEYRTQMHRPNVYATPRAITSGQPSASGTGAMLALPPSQSYIPEESSTPTNGWNNSSYGTTWYPNQ